MFNFIRQLRDLVRQIGAMIDSANRDLRDAGFAEILMPTPDGTRSVLFDLRRPSE